MACERTSSVAVRRREAWGPGAGFPWERYGAVDEFRVLDRAGAPTRPRSRKRRLARGSSLAVESRCLPQVRGPCERSRSECVPVRQSTPAMKPRAIL